MPEYPLKPLEKNTSTQECQIRGQVCPWNFQRTPLKCFSAGTMSTGAGVSRAMIFLSLFVFLPQKQPSSHSKQSHCTGPNSGVQIPFAQLLGHCQLSLPELSSSSSLQLKSHDQCPLSDPEPITHSGLFKRPLLFCLTQL